MDVVLVDLRLIDDHGCEAIVLRVEVSRGHLRSGGVAASLLMSISNLTGLPTVEILVLFG